MQQARLINLTPRTTRSFILQIPYHFPRTTRIQVAHSTGQGFHLTLVQFFSPLF